MSGRFAGTICAILFLTVTARAAEVTLNADVRFQTIEGWGTSLVGWDIGGTPYNDSAWRAAYRDAGLNIIRFPMVKDVLLANRQNPNYATPVTLGPDLQTNIAKMKFDIQPLLLWVDFARWLKKNALEPERVKFTGSPWTPPHWMKGPTGSSQYWVGNQADGSHPTPWLSGDFSYGPPNTGDSIGGRLKTEDANILPMYGRYIAAWVRGFEQQFGLPLYMISLQNESTFENPFDSMSFIKNAAGQTDHAEYAKGLKSVKDAWQAYGLTTKVMGPHVALIGPTPDSPWALNDQMNMIKAVKNHADAGLIGFLSYYNSNYYMGGDEAAAKATAGYYHGRSAVPANWASWTYAPGVKQDGKPIWVSETSFEDPAWVSGNSGAIVVAVKVHNALVWANVSAYVYWQMSDQSAAEHGEILLGKSHLSDPHASRKYCAYKHFSRYVRPGAQRIQALFENGKVSTGGASEYDTLRGLSASAFVHDQDGRLTCVLLNLRATSQNVTVNLPAAYAQSSFEAYRTSQNEGFVRLPDLTPVGGRLTLTSPSASLVTVTGTLSRPQHGDFDHDGDIDLTDFGHLQACFSERADAELTPGCADADLTGDTIVNQSDLVLFRDCLRGAGVPPASECGG